MVQIHINARTLAEQGKAVREAGESLQDGEEVVLVFPDCGGAVSVRREGDTVHTSPVCIEE